MTTREGCQRRPRVKEIELIQRLSSICSLLVPMWRPPNVTPAAASASGSPLVAWEARAERIAAAAVRYSVKAGAGPEASRLLARSNQADPRREAGVNRNSFFWSRFAFLTFKEGSPGWIPIVAALVVAEDGEILAFCPGEHFFVFAETYIDKVVHLFR
jgi:hypothetical protein